VQGSNRFIWVAGLGLVALAGGCQGSGGPAGSAGPSPLFGQAFVPSQSEPAVESGGTGRNTAAAQDVADSSSELDGDGSSTASRNRSRWLPGNDKPPAPRKALPVSARTDSMADDDGLDR
jgi:hypothetical protein